MNDPGPWHSKRTVAGTVTPAATLTVTLPMQWFRESVETADSATSRPFPTGTPLISSCGVDVVTSSVPVTGEMPLPDTLYVTFVISDVSLSLSARAIAPVGETSAAGRCCREHATPETVAARATRLAARAKGAPLDGFERHWDARVRAVCIAPTR